MIDLLRREISNSGTGVKAHILFVDSKKRQERNVLAADEIGITVESDKWWVFLPWHGIVSVAIEAPQPDIPPV